MHTLNDSKILRPYLDETSVTEIFLASNYNFAFVLYYCWTISRMVYLNVVVNVIKKLRGEAVLAAKHSPAGGSNSSSSNREMKPNNLMTTHLQVLAGKPGSIGTWSIEKKTSTELVRLCLKPIKKILLLFFFSHFWVFSSLAALKWCCLIFLLFLKIFTRLVKVSTKLSNSNWFYSDFKSILNILTGRRKFLRGGFRRFS